MTKIITGLDIGSAQIKCVVTEERKPGQPLSLLSAFKHPSAGFRKGMLIDPDEALRSLRDLILDIDSISKKAKRNIVVNMNNEHIKTLHSRGVAVVARADQEIQQDDLDRVFQASQAIKMPANHVVLHNIIKEYFVDDIQNIQNPTGMSGNRLEVGTFIILGFNPQVSAVVGGLERVGGGVAGLFFNPMASSRAVLTKKQKDLGVILIDFGAGTTSFTVYEEGKVMESKSIPIGANYITNDIAIGLRTSVETAEKLKLAYGCAEAREVNRRDMIRLEEFESGNAEEVPKKFLAEIIEVRLEELLELINNELKTLGKNGRLPAGAVLVGGGAKLSGLVNLVRRYLKLPTQIGLPNLKNFEILNTSYEDLFDDPEFAVAAGLALLGNETENPLPESPGIAPWVRRIFRSLKP